MANLGVVWMDQMRGETGSGVMVFLWVERRWEWVVHDWPVGGTNWRGSRQILQVGGGGWEGGGAENWVPHAVQMGRGEGGDMVDCDCFWEEGGGLGSKWVNRCYFSVHIVLRMSQL